jgi:hypothetical protein
MSSLKMFAIMAAVPTPKVETGRCTDDSYSVKRTLISTKSYADINGMVSMNEYIWKLVAPGSSNSV